MEFLVRVFLGKLGGGSDSVVAGLPLRVFDAVELRSCALHSF